MTSAPLVTDGPYAEAKEVVAGYQMIEVDSMERAIEIAARVSAVPGPGGVPLQQPIEIRQVMDDPARRPVSDLPLEDLLRRLAPRVLGAVMRQSGGLDGAEDATQEALLAAARHWPEDGVPDNPLAWLVQAASRRLTDQIRSDQARARGEAAALHEPPPAAVPERDDTLTVMLMCCHPVLTPASAVALTLRAVGGLTTAEIAHAFGVPEATMAQRISRAKQRIKASGVPFLMPGAGERPERLRSVLHVLYLIYNEGYVAASGTRLYRLELSAEAIRLSRMLRELLPDDPQVTGPLALMLLTEARRAAPRPAESAASATYGARPAFLRPFYPVCL